MLRTTTQKIKDFLLFPLRAITVIENNRWGLSSLMSERFDYVAREVQRYTLDVGCGKHNRFIAEYLNNNGQGIDVYLYEGLSESQIVKDMTHLPFCERNI